MSDSSGRQYQKLPPGWDLIQLEDPRRYRQLQNERCSSESIAMQGPGGSPYHVYPTNNMQAMRAFQTPTHNSHLLSSSRFALDASPLPIFKSNPIQTSRLMANMSRRSTIQETSFSNQIDTNAVVHKIQNMFPTASENHIRLLLKKYYNREAVVISALQVEKHPLTMPGPFVTPPAQRHLFHSNSAVYMTPPVRRIDVGHESIQFSGNYSRTASPAPTGRLGSVISISSASGSNFGHVAFQGSPKVGDHLMRNSPKPQHSSPKMKLRYMKTIFPKADETLLLDILANADNNVQKASQKLISLGYLKRDFTPPPKTGKQTDDLIKIIPLRPREYTDKEKDKIKERISEKYPQIAERILLMALESVNYAEDRAIQILQIVQEEEAERQFVKANKESSLLTLKKTNKEADDSKNQLKDRPDDKNPQLNNSDDSMNDLCKKFKSVVGCIAAYGPNNTLAKGANENLLLADYVTWNGANPNLKQGQRHITNGPDGSLRIERNYKPLGHNSQLCKGPQRVLVKGSVYAAQNAASSKPIDIKCN
uniref:CUE domain-containing protein n=1 Tax=Glossina brevipalpis TaxID=37001 RepID=A0A1A9WHK0_9MUSC